MRRRRFLRRERGLNLAERLMSVLALLSVLGSAFFIYVETSLHPMLRSFASADATAAVTEAVAETVEAFLSEDEYESSDLFTFTLDASGAIAAISSNTAEINRITGKLTALLCEKLKTLEQREWSVPLGEIIGGEILSNYGIPVKFSLLAASGAHVDIKSEFTSAGINQTVHRIYIEITTEIHLILNFGTVTEKNTVTYPLSETVIVGSVPNLYLPKQ